jgi:Tfp pilus assembly protein PilF
MRPPGAPAATLPGPRPPPGGADRELAGVLEQLQRGQWEAARQTLAALAARAPDVPRYRALLSYARGREAQLAHRLDEARVELQDALQIDPELQLAKTALAELFTRRK